MARPQVAALTTKHIRPLSRKAQKAQEGFGSFIEGLVKGSLSDNDSWSATAGSVVGGLIPGVGLVADVRDLGAAVAHVADGKQGAWLELGASIIGFVPGGDIAKGIAKSTQKAITKTAVKVGTELADDAAKVVKGSTAAAADGLSSAQKTAGKVHAPRGPPNKYGRNGGLEHQAKVAELVDAVKERGLTPKKEFRVETPNGHKQRRFVDVAGLVGDTPVEMHQVGKQTKGGRPVSREVDALDDIEGAKRTRPTFHPYNK